MSKSFMRVFEPDAVDWVFANQLNIKAERKTYVVNRFEWRVDGILDGACTFEVSESEAVIYIWSGLGEAYDYASSIHVKNFRQVKGVFKRLKDLSDYIDKMSKKQ